MSQVCPSGVGSKQNRDKRAVNIELKLIRMTETHTEINANVASYLLNVCASDVYSLSKLSLITYSWF